MLGSDNDLDPGETLRFHWTIAQPQTAPPNVSEGHNDTFTAVARSGAHITGVFSSMPDTGPEACEFWGHAVLG